MSQPKIVTGQKVDPAKLEEAKRLRREMTGQERILWSYLRANRFMGNHFRRQQVIRGFIADFYCHAAGLVVKVDGPIHAQQADYDADRDAILTALGLHVLKIKNEEIHAHIGGC